MTVAKVRLGPNVTLTVRAYTAAELGTAMVEMRCAGDHLHLTIEQAEAIADALVKAAAAARQGTGVAVAKAGGKE
jgi:hypothetical protein